MKTKPKIQFIDFDGTITYKDSFIKFVFYYNGFFIGIGLFSLIIPIYVLFKFVKKDTGILKEFVITLLYKNTTVYDFDKIAIKFSQEILPKMIKQSFKDHIFRTSKNSKIVIVSASLYNYLKPWCEKNNFDLIATGLDYKNGKLTGSFNTKNCNGEEKARRIKEKYNLNDFSEIYVFGNSNGDKEMLELGTKKHYKYFN